MTLFGIFRSLVAVRDTVLVELATAVVTGLRRFLESDLRFRRPRNDTTQGPRTERRHLWGPNSGIPR